MESWCSGCGMLQSSYDTKLQEIDLHCRNCGVVVKHWSCYKHSCEVSIWNESRSCVCGKCTKSELKFGSQNDSSMLALSLSLQLYYKCKRSLTSDAEGDPMIELWRKARVSGTEYARAAAKEAAAAAYRASEASSLLWSASDRVENAARTMMGDLARCQARTRARASAPAVLSHSSGLSHLGYSKLGWAVDSQEQNAERRDQFKDSTKRMIRHADQALVRKERKRRVAQSSNRYRAILCGCGCQ